MSSNVIHSSSRPKITILSSIQVFPPLAGGHMRTANLAQGLASLGFEVTIHSLTGRKKDYIRRANSGGDEVSSNVYEYVNRSAIWGVLQWFCYRSSLPPLWLSLVRSWMLSNRLKQDAASADIGICDFPFVHHLSSCFSSKRIYLNTHNVEQDLWGDPIRKFFVRRVEERAIKKFDAILFCSEEDREKLATPSQRTYIVPNGIDALAYQPIPEVAKTKMREDLTIDLDRTVILFTGSQFAPNLRALKRLRSWVQENVEFARDNNLFFLIAGSVSEPEEFSGVYRSTGFVEDILPYFKIANAALNLTQDGSGVNVKMLEFISSEIPILSTKFGTRGLKLINEASYVEVNLDGLKSAFETLLKVKDLQAMAIKAKEDNIDSITMKHSLGNFVQMEGIK